jgi:LacI family transcriptional regulator
LGLASVSVDDELGAFQAFEHLMDLGHRRIGFVTGPPSFAWFSERRKGVVRALRRRRVRYADTVVEVAVDEVTVAAGEQAGRQLLAGANRPTAAFCVNDLLALGVLRALRSEGLTAPQHLSLVGYDDLAFAGALSPALTTVRQQPFDIGRLGATLLLDASVQRHLVLQPELIVRDSTSPCRPDRPRPRRRRSS